jgi:hypothetical protein
VDAVATITFVYTASANTTLYLNTYGNGAYSVSGSSKNKSLAGATGVTAVRLY